MATSVSQAETTTHTVHYMTVSQSIATYALVGRITARSRARDGMTGEIDSPTGRTARAASIPCPKEWGNALRPML